jgi:hypothetical protein
MIGNDWHRFWKVGGSQLEAGEFESGELVFSERFSQATPVGLVAAPGLVESDAVKFARRVAGGLLRARFRQAEAAQSRSGGQIGGRGIQLNLSRSWIVE